MNVRKDRRILGLAAAGLLMLATQVSPAFAQVQSPAATASKAQAIQPSPGPGGGGGGMMGRGGMTGPGGGMMEGRMSGMMSRCQQAEAANFSDLDRARTLLESARTSTDAGTSRRDIAKAEEILASMRQRTATCSTMMGQMRQMMRGGAEEMQTPAAPGSTRP